MQLDEIDESLLNKVPPIPSYLPSYPWYWFTEGKIWTTMMTLYLSALISYVLFRHVLNGYQAFLSLGPGGTPSTFKGFLRISFLGLFRLRAPLEAPEITPTIYPKRGFLDSKIPEREGPRPLVHGLAPQRQITQKASIDAYTATQNVMAELAKSYPKELFLAPSAIEGGRSSALFSRAAAMSGKSKREAEICHLHGVDGSMHVVLHPADIATVLGLGYGERHPLARSNWWWRPVVPEGFILLYSCRTEAELRVLRRVMCAAAWNVCGREFS
ncbi:MAG: hypothetical protein Q9227_006453 [Pyrenula ochraceoflavens]